MHHHVPCAHNASLTKDQRNYLNRDLRHRLFPYLRGIVTNLGGSPIAAGGVDNHVHMLMGLPPTLCIADAMRLIKTNSSKWIRETFSTHDVFAWQTGYAAFTVSASVADRARKYIEDQESHHRARAFDDEVAAMAKRHGVTVNVSPARK
jgi:REP element-mobilizing transposase RayT